MIGDTPGSKKFEIHEPEKKKFVVHNMGEVVMSDIYLVGPAKPMGYLPLRALEEHSDRDEEELVRHLEERGLEVWFATGGTWMGPSLWVFHRKSLQALLDNRKDVLVKYGWPIRADEFIRKVASEYAEPQDLFDLIADAFGDKLHPDRSDRKLIYQGFTSLNSLKSSTMQL